MSPSIFKLDLHNKSPFFIPMSCEQTRTQTHRTLEGWDGTSQHLARLEVLPVTLPNVRDLIKISSASDDSVYFVWMSWSIWLSGEKSNNKAITRNLSRGNSSSNGGSGGGTLQYIIDWGRRSRTASCRERKKKPKKTHTPHPPTAGFEVIPPFRSCSLPCWLSCIT